MSRECAAGPSGVVGGVPAAYLSAAGGVLCLAAFADLPFAVRNGARGGGGGGGGWEKWIHQFHETSRLVPSVQGPATQGNVPEI